MRCHYCCSFYGVICILHENFFFYSNFVRKQVLEVASKCKSIAQDIHRLSFFISGID